MPYLIHREAGTLPTLNTSTMDNHNTWLDLFDSFERLQTELEARESLMVLNRDIQPKWEIQAFLNNELQWADPAYDEDELQSLKNAATEAGFTYTVEPVK
jgi:hypothetical protein